MPVYEKYLEARSWRKWGGEWDTENDVEMWRTESRPGARDPWAIISAVVRHTEFGYLNGLVAVSATHPWALQNDWLQATAHKGFTTPFCGRWVDIEAFVREQLTLPSKNSLNSKYWFVPSDFIITFSANKRDDLSPEAANKNINKNIGRVYRNFEYMRQQTQSLTQQAIEAIKPRAEFEVSYGAYAGPAAGAVSVYGKSVVDTSEILERLERAAADGTINFEDLARSMQNLELARDRRTSKSKRRLDVAAKEEAKTKLVRILRKPVQDDPND